VKSDGSWGGLGKEVEPRKKILNAKLILTQTLDVAKNEEKYQNYIRPMALGYKNLEKIEREQVKKFFLTNVIGDEQRKELWTLKIGNRLKINKTIYENLVERLKYEDFEPKIEKLIKDDLNRT
jgi:hypothetical protein